MAAGDYVAADRRNANGDDIKDQPVTAGNKILETEQATPDAETQAAADAAGVSHPAYIDYAEALTAFQTRPDIEPLQDRRAREYGNDFTDGDFMRQSAYDEDGAATAPPRPGTVYGHAPKSSTDLLDEDQDNVTATTDTDDTDPDVTV